MKRQLKREMKGFFSFPCPDPDKNRFDESKNKDTNLKWIIKKMRDAFYQNIFVRQHH